MANEAYILTQPGSFDNFTRKEIPDPIASPDQIIISHKAWGINGHDVESINGKRKLANYPAIIGVEAMGTIDYIGEKINGWNIGQRVGYYTQPSDAFCLKRNIDPQYLISIPDDISNEVAAAVMRKASTAHFLVHRTFFLNSSHTVLILDVAGGLGHFIATWAVMKGCNVIGTVGSENKIEFAKSLGCKAVYLHDDPELVNKINKYSNNSIQVVYDLLGGQAFTRLSSCLDYYALWVFVGMRENNIQPIDMENTKHSIFTCKPNLEDYKLNRMELILTLHEVFALISKKKLNYKLHKNFAWSELKEALLTLHNRQNMGACIVSL